MKRKKRKKSKKLTKAKIKKNLKRLKNKALKLWALAVKVRAHNKCEAPGCDSTEFLNSHHLESKYNCKALMLDVRNGLCLDAGHHRFKQDSAHKSFCFTLMCLYKHRESDIDYLLEHRNDVVELTQEYLENKIIELEGIILARRNADLQKSPRVTEGDIKDTTSQSVS